MDIDVVTTSGVKTVRAELIPDSPDGLAIVSKWHDGAYSMCVVAKVPGTDVWLCDVWLCVACLNDLTRAWFPKGKLKQGFQDLIDRLSSSPAPWDSYCGTS